MEKLGVSNFWMIIVGQGSEMGRESVAPSGKPGRNWSPQHPPSHYSPCSGSVYGVLEPSSRPVIGRRKEK